MVTRRDRSSDDAETHRLKNRLRQQRYRARKREEKAKKDGGTILPSCSSVTDFPNAPNMPWAKRDGGTILPSCSSITGFPNATNMPWVSTSGEIHSNTVNVGARNGTRSADVDHGETDSSRFKPIVGWQHEQHCNAESVPADAEGNTTSSPENSYTFHLHKIQPLCQMESESTINNFKMQDGYAMKPPDQSERRRSNEEIMSRRLKNRDRQRRYRARKRLEAETMNTSHHINQSTTSFLPLATQPSGSGIITERVSRTHCLRDWKQDARKAHMSKEPDESPPELLNLRNDNQINSSSPTENREKPVPEDESQADNQIRSSSPTEYKEKPVPEDASQADNQINSSSPSETKENPVPGDEPQTDNQMKSSSPTENKVNPVPEYESQSDNQVVSFSNSESNPIATLGRRDWKVAARTKVD